MKPLKMIYLSEENGMITPLRFQLREADESYKTIKVQNIVMRTEEKLAGSRMLIFRCQSEINGVLQVYELKFEPASSRWYLYKM